MSGLAFVTKVLHIGLTMPFNMDKEETSSRLFDNALVPQQAHETRRHKGIVCRIDIVFQHGQRDALTAL